MFTADAMPSPQSISIRPLDEDESCTLPICVRVAAGRPISSSASKAQLAVMIKNRCMAG